MQIHSYSTICVYFIQIKKDDLNVCKLYYLYTQIVCELLYFVHCSING